LWSFTAVIRQKGVLSLFLVVLFCPVPPPRGGGGREDERCKGKLVVKLTMLWMIIAGN